MRTIDADALIDNMADYVADGYAISRVDYESYTKMVQTAPTIDAVSIEDVIAIIDDLYREGVIDYMQAWELRMRVRAKGADDEVR